MLALLLVSAIAGSMAMPPLHVEPFVPLSEEDYKFLSDLPSTRAALMAGFRYKYVGDGGIIRNTKSSFGNWLEVAASPMSSETAHYDTALIVSRMTRYMPPDFFARLASQASVGVFTRTEKLSIYPEYHYLADTPACRGICTGHCSVTCTFDGRKWDTVAGAGGRRAVILDDNVMCSSRDPYNHHENILNHEFAHTINHHAMSTSYQTLVTQAYHHAKSANLWRASSYAMANYEEYFAEATTSFYNVNQQGSAGGMNQCGYGSTYCDTEQHARDFLKQRDPLIFNVLSHTYTNDRPNTPGGLTVCVRI